MRGESNASKIQNCRPGQLEFKNGQLGYVVGHSNQLLLSKFFDLSIPYEKSKHWTRKSRKMPNARAKRESLSLRIKYYNACSGPLSKL